MQVELDLINKLSQSVMARLRSFIQQAPNDRRFSTPDPQMRKIMGQMVGLRKQLETQSSYLQKVEPMKPVSPHTPVQHSGNFQQGRLTPAEQAFRQSIMPS